MGCSSTVILRNSSLRIRWGVIYQFPNNASNWLPPLTPPPVLLVEGVGLVGLVVQGNKLSS